MEDDEDYKGNISLFGDTQSMSYVPSPYSLTFQKMASSPVDQVYEGYRLLGIQQCTRGRLKGLILEDHNGGSGAQSSHGQADVEISCTSWYGESTHLFKRGALDHIFPLVWQDFLENTMARWSAKSASYYLLMILDVDFWCLLFQPFLDKRKKRRPMLMANFGSGKHRGKTHWFRLISA